jgi:hypothetical protein
MSGHVVPHIRLHQRAPQDSVDGIDDLADGNTSRREMRAAGRQRLQTPAKSEAVLDLTVSS